MSAGLHAGFLSAEHLERPANLFAVVAARLSVVRELLEQAADLAPPAGRMAGQLAERLALVSGELRTLAVVADLGGRLARLESMGDAERERLSELLKSFEAEGGAAAPTGGS